MDSACISICWPPQRTCGSPAGLLPVFCRPPAYPLACSTTQARIPTPTTSCTVHPLYSRLVVVDADDMCCVTLSSFPCTHPLNLHHSGEKYNLEYDATPAPEKRRCFAEASTTHSSGAPPIQTCFQEKGSHGLATALSSPVLFPVAGCSVWRAGGRCRRPPTLLCRFYPGSAIDGTLLLASLQAGFVSPAVGTRTCLSLSLL